jgi:hemerythrin-like domain-containing protein
MKITDAFLGEHGILYVQLDNVEQLRHGSPTPEQVRTSAAMLESVLQPHADLEEELLFAPALAVLGHPHAALDVMHEEHEEIKERLATALGTNRIETALEALLQAAELARYHFLKEEQVTFPLAEQLLAYDELVRLGGEWAARRSVVLASAG